VVEMGCVPQCGDEAVIRYKTISSSRGVAPQQHPAAHWTERRAADTGASACMTSSRSASLAHFASTRSLDHGRLQTLRTTRLVRLMNIGHLAYTQTLQRSPSIPGVPPRYTAWTTQGLYSTSHVQCTPGLVEIHGPCGPAGSIPTPAPGRTCRSRLPLIRALRSSLHVRVCRLPPAAFRLPPSACLQVAANLDVELPTSRLDAPGSRTGSFSLHPSPLRREPACECGAFLLSHGLRGGNK